MSNWGKFAKNSQSSGETKPHPTMHLRQVIKSNGDYRLEQMVEYRNDKAIVVNTEWVEIPIILEVKE